MGGTARDTGETCPAAPAISIHVLGSFAVTVDGTDAPALGPTARRLVTALALAAANGITRTVADLVIEVYGGSKGDGYDEPNAEPAKPARRVESRSARRSLATLVWRLRQEWGADAIGSDRYHYWLDLERCDIDVLRFRTAIQRGQAAARELDSVGAADAFRTALECWRDDGSGPPALPEPQRARLTELRDGAAEQWADMLLNRGEFAEATTILTRVVADRPTWEHSQALLVRCLTAVGNLAGARRAFDQASRALLAEGVTPGAELAAAGADVENSVGPAGGEATGERSAGNIGGPTAADMGELVGREPQVERLLDTVTAALRGRRPALVVVSGEAGVGKSALVRAACIGVDQAIPGTRFEWVRCDRRSTLPFGPLADLIAAAPDAHPPTDTNAHVHQALLAGIFNLTTRGGLVLPVEDLHWAPPESVVALQSVLARCGRLPLVILATTRDPHNYPQLVALADDHIMLTGLDRDSIARVAELPPGSEAAARLHRLTGGNPLFLRQLLHADAYQAPSSAPSTGTVGAGPTEPITREASALESHLPATVNAAIDAHLARVPADVLTALQIAATIGDRFDLLTLAAISGPLHRRLPSWQEAVSAAISHGLIRPDPEGEARSSSAFQFVHALVTEHLYQQLSPTERTATHAAIARALARISLGRPAPADLLAYHATRGWPELETATVIDALLAAAQAVGAQLDFRQSATYYRSAIDLLAIDPAAATQPDVVDILGLAAGASVAAGDLDGALDLYGSQEQQADSAGLPQARLKALLGALRVQFMRRSSPRFATAIATALDTYTQAGALPGLQGAVGDTDDRGGDLERDVALVGETLAAIHVYQPATAARLLADISARAPAAAPRLRLAVWEHRSVPEQLRCARELTAELRAAGPGSTDPTIVTATWLRLWVSEVAAGLRRFDDPPPHPDGSPESGDDLTGFDLAQWRITCAIATGDTDRATSLIEAALTAPQHPEPTERARRAASFYGQQLYLRIATGTVGAIAESPLLANPTWVTRHPLMRYLRTYFATRAGGSEQAWTWADELTGEVADGDIPESDLLPRLILLTEVCRQLDHRRGLEVCREALSGHRGEHGIFRFGQYWGVADLSLGDIHQALGDQDAAIDCYETSVAAFDAVGALPQLALARRALDAAVSSRSR